LNPVTEIVESQKSFENSEITISPNPNNGDFILDVNGDYIGKIELSIINISGRIVHSRSFDKVQLLESFQISTELKTGVYFIKIGLHQNSQVAKLVIQ